MIARGSARFVVVECGEPPDRMLVEECAAGRRPVSGWQGGRGELCLGVVADADDAAAAVLAALRGADLLVDARAERGTVDRLCDDLRRLGELVHVVERPAADPQALDAQALALVGRLLQGMTLGAAARELHISRRTADRRLAAVRAAVDATTTAEAVRKVADRYPHLRDRPAP
jgi:DNA-binding NarL/FixJ family response regulator